MKIRKLGLLALVLLMVSSMGCVYILLIQAFPVEIIRVFSINSASGSFNEVLVLSAAELKSKLDEQNYAGDVTDVSIESITYEIVNNTSNGGSVGNVTVTVQGGSSSAKTVFSLPNVPLDETDVRKIVPLDPMGVQELDTFAADALLGSGALSLTFVLSGSVTPPPPPNAQFTLRVYVTFSVEMEKCQQTFDPLAEFTEEDMCGGL